MIGRLITDSDNKMIKIKQRKTRDLHEMFKIQLTFETISGVKEKHVKYTLGKSIKEVFLKGRVNARKILYMKGIF